MSEAVAVLKETLLERELPLAIGVSKRAARRIARQLGHKIGQRRVVLRSELLTWLERQPTPQPRTRPEAP